MLSEVYFFCTIQQIEIIVTYPRISNVTLQLVMVVKKSILSMHRIYKKAKEILSTVSWILLRNQHDCNESDYLKVMNDSYQKISDDHLMKITDCSRKMIDSSGRLYFVTSF